MGACLRLTDRDITTLEVDAIVNAANEYMLGGGGVDGAIHRAAGPELLEACKQVPFAKPRVRCPTGQARITPAGELQARYVIHTVGPIYRSASESAPLLSSAYHNAFELALQHQCRSVAAPAISCGVFGYPLQDAAQIALEVSAEPAFDRLDITFYLFNQAIYDIWSAALR